MQMTKVSQHVDNTDGGKSATVRGAFGKHQVHPLSISFEKRLS